MVQSLWKAKSESEVGQSCLTLCDPMDCSLPGFSVHEIFQARVPEWVAISFSRRSSWPRDQTWISCIAGRHFTLWATREAVTLENNLTVLYVVKRKITILLSSFTLAVYPWGKKMYAHPKTCTWNFIAAFFIIAQKWGPSKCPSANEWINKKRILDSDSVLWHSKKKWSTDTQIRGTTWNSSFWWEN